MSRCARAAALLISQLGLLRRRVEVSSSWCATVVGSCGPGENVRCGAVPPRRQRVGATATGVAGTVLADGSGGRDTCHRGRGCMVDTSHGDAVVGAIAVSGGSPEHDDECAEAGIAALSAARAVR
ncbi:heme-binding protein [Nocardia sp. NPDC004573]